MLAGPVEFGTGAIALILAVVVVLYLLVPGAAAWFARRRYMRSPEASRVGGWLIFAAVFMVTNVALQLLASVLG